MNSINLSLEGLSYEILIGRDKIRNIDTVIKNSTENNKVLIVSDERLKNNVLQTIKEELSGLNYTVNEYLLKGGKKNKTIKEVLSIYNILEEIKFARDSTIIALGGGVVGDLAGFVASTWFRGMNLIHIPTTLTGMVDSSVGGKVAVHFQNTINAIGNYHHPIGNIIDLNFIDTLPDREYLSGMAEIIKCAIISDKLFFNYLVNNVDKIRAREESYVLHIIKRAIQIKIDHVSGDVRESGKRLLLNYGHTLGHAVEMSTAENGEEKYRHGEGVAIGMMAASYIAEEFLNIEKKVKIQLANILRLYDLPTYVEDPNDIFELCIRNVKRDNKRINNDLRIILAEEIGKAGIYTNIPFDLVKRAFIEILK